VALDNKLLLAKCITLLYRESLLPEKEDNSAERVRKVIESLKLPELALSVNNERECLVSLKDTALYMCENPLTHTYEKEEFLQRLKINCSADDRLFSAFEKGIGPDLDEPGNLRTIIGIKKFLDDAMRENDFLEKLKKATNTLLFQREKISNVRKFIRELRAELEPYEIENDRKDPAIVDEVDMSDKDGLTAVCKAIHEMATAETVLKTGWQGLNQMLQGGMRRGETWSIQALQHNYKTGFSLTLFKQLCVYNIPKLKDPSKKPLMIRISFEDALKSNVQFLYQNIKENTTGVLPDIKTVDPMQMAQEVIDHVQSSGYHVRMLRVNPSEWGYADIVNYVLLREAEGYEVHCVMVDYLPMLPTTGCIQGTAGADLRDMVRRLRNFHSAKDILFITPWQISTEGKNLRREGVSNFAEKIANGGYYDGSKRIDHEVDGELVISIEEYNGDSYLVVQRGKHRLPTNIPHAWKSFVLPFPKNGSILDDLNGPRSDRRKLGGGTSDSGQENSFHEFDIV
jgi:hypothetical protein